MYLFIVKGKILIVVLLLTLSMLEILAKENLSPVQLEILDKENLSQVQLEILQLVEKVSLQSPVALSTTEEKKKYVVDIAKAMKESHLAYIFDWKKWVYNKNC